MKLQTEENKKLILLFAQVRGIEFIRQAVMTLFYLTISNTTKSVCDFRIHHSLLWSVISETFDYNMTVFLASKENSS